MIGLTAGVLSAGGRQVSLRAVRGDALLAAALLAAACFSPATWPVYVLMINLTIKTVVGFKYSPLGWLTRKASGMLGSTARLVDLAPRRFGAYVFPMFLIAAALLGPVFGVWPAYRSVIGLLLALTLLEGLLGLCVACRVRARLPSAWTGRRSGGVSDRP